MTVINRHGLLIANPIRDMSTFKQRCPKGVSHGLAEVGYDIRIKQDILFWMNNGKPMITVTSEDATDVENHLGRFVLASAIEEFQMPAELVGIVHDKSTWARKGLSVFNTVIEPGWNGFLTLELVYHGQDELHIPAGTGIAQVIFHELTIPAHYEGQYQNQEDRPVGSLIDTVS